MRIGTELSEDTSEQVQDLADENGWQKSKAYTELINNGLQIQKRRETIKQYLVDFFAEEKSRHEERIEALKDEYDIEKVEWIDTSMQVFYKGDEYSFSGDPTDIITINGEAYSKNVCPECGSEQISLDHESVEYGCESCGEHFEKSDTEYTVPEEDRNHVKEFAQRRHELITYVVKQVDEILDSTLSYLDGRRGEWLHPGVYEYENGFQSVRIPFWCTDKERIRFTVSNYITDYSSVRNPLYRKAKMDLTEDHLQLVREVEAVNSSADRIEPIYVDSRGSKPEIIEVRGSSYEETRLPHRTVGYELEKRQPKEDDLKTNFKGEEVKIELDYTADEVTWIKVVNDKRIKRPQEYSDTEDYYLAVEEENLNPIHLIDRETQEPECGEELEKITTIDDRLNRDEPVSRRGICSDCLDEVEEF